MFILNGFIKKFDCLDVFVFKKSNIKHRPVVFICNTEHIM